jgi:hypothetical protein
LALAMVQINNDWDWEGASTSVKKASLLAPGSATVVGIQAFLARHLERVEEAVVLYKQAIGIIYDACLGLPFEGWFLFCQVD